MTVQQRCVLLVDAGSSKTTCHACDSKITLRLEVDSSKTILCLVSWKKKYTEMIKPWCQRCQGFHFPRKCNNSHINQ